MVTESFNPSVMITASGQPRDRGTLRACRVTKDQKDPGSLVRSHEALAVAQDKLLISELVIRYSLIGACRGWGWVGCTLFQFYYIPI